MTADSRTSDLRPTTEADELYTLHAPLLRSIAIGKFKVPRPDAEGLVHDVFAAYFSRVDQVREPRGYLVGAICNSARHYWRDRKTEERVLSSADHASPREPETDAVNRKLLVATTLARMGEGCRELLRRYYLEGETTASIAASRDTTPDYILFLLHRCRKRAREIVRSLS